MNTNEYLKQLLKDIEVGDFLYFHSKTQSWGDLLMAEVEAIRLQDGRIIDVLIGFECPKCDRLSVASLQAILMAEDDDLRYAGVCSDCYWPRGASQLHLWVDGYPLA